jgi:hypothetical protein
LFELFLVWMDGRTGFDGEGRLDFDARVAEMREGAGRGEEERRRVDGFGWGLRKWERMDSSERVERRGRSRSVVFWREGSSTASTMVERRFGLLMALLEESMGRGGGWLEEEEDEDVVVERKTWDETDRRPLPPARLLSCLPGGAAEEGPLPAKMERRFERFDEAETRGWLGSRGGRAGSLLLPSEECDGEE